MCFYFRIKKFLFSASNYILYSNPYYVVGLSNIHTGRDDKIKIT